MSDKQQQQEPNPADVSHETKPAASLEERVANLEEKFTSLMSRIGVIVGE